MIDTNENGVSDLWEEAHNNGQVFNGTFDPQADPDQDGWTNAREASAGTSPFDSNPPGGFVLPDIAHIPAVYDDPDEDGISDHLVTPEAITITWPTIPGKLYTLLGSPDLTPASWLEIDSPRIGNGNEMGNGIVLTQAGGGTVERLFWRVSITDTDSDVDGLTDAEENTLGTNPADPDTNGNGTPDADEFDFDKDGLIGKLDAAPNDKTISWEKTFPTRYAMFDVPMASDALGNPVWPTDVNSQGMVLFPDGLDWKGAFDPLVDPEDGLATDGIAINDNGNIFGAAGYDLSHPELRRWGASIWETPTSQPLLPSTEGLQAAEPRVLNGFESIFSDDGGFVSFGQSIPNGNFDVYHWVRGTNGDYQCTQAEGFWYAADGGARMGWNGADQILVSSVCGANLGATFFDKLTVVRETFPVLTSHQLTPARVFINGAWKPSQTLESALNISKSGIAHLQTAPAALNIPDGLAFWTNDRFYSLDTMVPDLPQSYQDWEKVSIPDMAPKGTFLLKMDSGHPSAASHCAVCLPCAVEEETSEQTRTFFKDGENDTVPFTGVDNVSITATKPDPAAANKIWIMAPIGSESAANDVKFHVPVTGLNPLLLEGDNLDGNHTVAQDDGKKLAIKGVGTDTTDKKLVLKTGTREALNGPVGIKAMKRRKVEVTLTPVILKRPDGSTLGPNRLPDKERLEKYLNKTYLLQVNAEIELTYAAPVPLEFSTATKANLNLDPNKPEDELLKAFYPSLGGGTLDYGLGEEDAFDSIKDAGADINVFYVGGITTIVGWGKKDTSPEGYDTWRAAGANGVANKDKRFAWVSDTRFDVYPWDDDLPEKKENYTRLQMRTVAHEIGHVICGYGHPDDKGGPAPLDGTNHNERLMRSGGSGAIPRGNRLVKGEWDAAEIWLNKLPYGQQTGN